MNTQTVLPSPVITAPNGKVMQGTLDRLYVKGRVQPGLDVVVTIRGANLFLVYQVQGKANDPGEWDFRLDRELADGTYSVAARSIDSQGAYSTATMSVKVRVAQEPVLSLGGIDITLGWLLVVVTVAGLAVVAWLSRKARVHTACAHRQAVIINRDMQNAFRTVKGDLVAQDHLLGGAQKRISDRLDTIERYAGKDIEKLG